MRELLRTNDPTVIAFATAILEGEGIEVFQMDVHMSVLEGSIGVLPRRLMVLDRDHFRASAILRDNDIETSGAEMPFAEEELTTDAFLGGRLTVRQPRAGYRAGVDPVLLAAAVPARAGEAVLDLGAGPGWRSLCLGRRVRGGRGWPGSRCRGTMPRLRGRTRRRTGSRWRWWRATGADARGPAGAELRPCHREPALLPARGGHARPMTPGARRRSGR
jgi:hypothetical protein